jgi:hypothetical protein
MLRSHGIGREYSEYGLWVAWAMIGGTVVQAGFLVFMYHRLRASGYAEYQDDVERIRFL